MKWRVDNLILDTDSYKSCHWLTYPPQTVRMFSYLESRGGRYEQTVFFGLQYLLKKYLTQPITMDMVEEAAVFFAAHGEPFNTDGWSFIVRELDGKLPVRIRAVPEGTVIPTQHILLSVESTNPTVFWVVSWLETMLVRLWYPITVATQSWHIRQSILSYLERTADDPLGEIPFKLHDFGSRGVSSRESAEIGGAAHLVNFFGSDTVVGVLCANHYYHHPMAAFSIPAAEHSCITSWGKEREGDAYRNMLARFGQPGKLVSVVSDSYDMYNAVSRLWGEELRQQVIDSGATVVIRPDSGNPPEVVLNTLYLLEDKFGCVVNSKGYKVLNHVRVIQGDGVNEESIRQILDGITLVGFSASNLVFGMGGALLQKVDRDTQQFAFKCSEITVKDDAGRLTDIPVYKDPVTDPGKKSKRGYLDLVKTDTGYETVNGGRDNSVLVMVYENGEALQEWTLEEIRQRAVHGRAVHH